MNRLDRRIAIIKAKKSGSFDPDQVYLGNAQRGRVARKLRTLIRNGQPSVLVTPRWSEASSFLDDLVADLQLGTPKVRARTLSVAPLQGRSNLEAWNWLVRAVMEFADLPMDGPLSHVIDRSGFRAALGGVFRRTVRSEPSALLICCAEHVPFEVLQDFVGAYDDHVIEAGEQRRLTLLLSGMITHKSFALREAPRLWLPDFGPREAVEALAECIGIADPHALWAMVGAVGGVPAMIERLGRSGEQGLIPHDRASLWRALGPLVDEIRAAVAIVSSAERLAERVETLAASGLVSEEPMLDASLVQAGLLVRDVRKDEARVALRAPLFADLAAGR